MTTPIYGVTPEGFETKRLIEVKNDLEESFIGEFGDINLDPQSVTGQIIGIFAKVFADIWENAQDVYLSQYPNSASGVSLDNVVALNGITRIPAQRTSVIGVATGAENTLIPANSLVRIPVTNAIFFSTIDSFISSSNAYRSIIETLALSAQNYTIILDNEVYFYNLPTMNFSGPFVAGNEISVRINGINLTTITFAVSSANTFTLLANELLTSPAIASANIVGTTIELIPVLGYSITINSVGLTGAGVPTYSQTLRIPSSTNDIATYLSALFSSSTKVISSNLGSEITIEAIDPASPFSIIVGINLQIIQTSSPIPFLAQTFGVIPAPANSMTEILTQIAGWDSITNPQAGVTGRNIETDAELRLRRASSLRVQGTATVEAIRARLLQDVPNVTSVTISENVTLTQSPIEIAFSIDFVALNNIEIFIDAISIGSVVFNTDQLTTMNLIKTLLETQSEINNVVVGGIGNRNLTITMNEIESIVLTFTITLGTTQPTYTLSRGLPPKSFECIVVGGTDQEVALKIWQTKPAGIETYGNTSIVIVDSQGNNQLIKFSRATIVYLFSQMIITLNPQETFPTNGFQLISDAILSYGNSLGIGLDVILQRLEAQAFLVSGVATATAQIAKTYSLSDTPVYVTTDIDILSTEISTWDLSRIEVTV